MKPLNCIAKLALVAALAVMATGCANGVYNLMPSAPVVPPGGAIYTQQRAPLVLSNQVPDVVPSSLQPAGGMMPAVATQGVKLPANMKCGTAEATNIVLYYQVLSVGWGDCSIETAARNAGITKIAFADYEIMSVLGFYNQIIVRVFGE
jgi:hypothetical protein